MRQRARRRRDSRGGRSPWALLVAAGVAAAAILALVVSRQGGPQPFRGGVLLARAAGPAVVIPPGAPGYPVPGSYLVRARLATAASGARYRVSAGLASRHGPEVVIDSRAYRWYDLGRLRAAGGGPFVVRLDAVLHAVGAGLLIERVAFWRAGRADQAIVFDARTARRVALLAMGTGDAVAIGPGASSYPSAGAYRVSARLATAVTGARYLVSAGVGLRRAPEVVVDSRDYRWYDLGLVRAVRGATFTLRVDGAIRVAGPGLLVDRVALRRVTLASHGVYGVVGALDGNRSRGRAVVDPRAVDRSAFLATDTGAIVVIPARVAWRPPAGVYRMRAKLATAAPGARYAVSAGFGGRKGPEVVVASPTYRWYDLGWTRAAPRRPFLLDLDSTLRAVGPGLLVDRVELRSIRLRTGAADRIVGALEGNRSLGSVVADPRASSGSVLLVTATGSAVWIGPGQPACPAAGSYRVRARLATAAGGARYRVSAAFGASHGPEVTVASGRYRWYDLGRLSADGGAFVLGLDGVLRAVGRGLLVDEIELLPTR